MRCQWMVCFLIGVVAWPGAAALAKLRRSGFANRDFERVTSVIDRGVQQAKDDAQELIEERQYVQGVARLQSVLEHAEDYFVEKDFKVRGAAHPGVKSQTHQILADLPAAGRAAYELHFGTAARTLLNESMLKNDMESVAEVASRYMMTAAGFEAMQILAARAFDHNQALEAAILCQAMTTHPRGRDELAGPLLLRAAYAWHLAEQPVRSRAALKELMTLDSPNAWRLGGRQLPVLETEREVAAWQSRHFGSPLPRLETPVSDWMLPRGGATGNESATSAYPAGGGNWTVSPLKYNRFRLEDGANEKLRKDFDRLSHQIERALVDENRQILPAAMPMIAGDRVIYRTLNDITAVKLRTGELLWRSSVTDSMLTWLSQSAAAESDNPNHSSPATIPGYLRQKLFRDQLSGTLTSDGRCVYAIEEAETRFGPLRPKNRMQNGDLSVIDPTNKLVAYELAGGRLLWEAGGLRGTPPLELSGVYFLGPPLPFAGRLYCLAEVKSELCLLALIPGENQVELDWSQTLIAINDGDWVAATRRQAGIIPVVAEGMMICPTTSGSVVAYDLLRRELRWGYSYGSQRTRSFPDVFEFGMSLIDDDERWIDNGPILADNRVLLTPRDSGELHCLDLVDGTLLWKRPRFRGLYVACVHDEAVVVVGRSEINAYSLKDGSELWSTPLEIPEPSGRGVRMGSRYLLPLSTGEIATIDLSAHRLLGRSRLPQDRIPGNLAIAEGALVSAGIHEVIGFRPLQEIQQQIERQLAANPRDAEALALRGELRLHHGEDEAAIDDLRESLRQNPELRVKRVLAGTMLNVLKKDLPRLRDAAAELETLTDEPRQRIEFLRLYAQSLMDVDDRVGAVNQLFRLSLVAEFMDELVSIGPGHAMTLWQNIRSQLQSIYDGARQEVRHEIDRTFAREFELALAADDRPLRVIRFVMLTIGHPAADPLLMRLAESNEELPEPITRTRLMERLTQCQTKSVAGAATARLASKSLAAELPRDAMPWIDSLANEFRSEVCLDGKTGQELSAEWLARDDVRHAKPIPAVWSEGPVDVERSRISMYKPATSVDIVTHVGHHFVDWSFEFEPSNWLLTARDSTLHIAWQLQLPNSPEAFRNLAPQLHIRGRRMALTTGLWLVVVEFPDSLNTPQVMFEKSLQSTMLPDRKANEMNAEKHLRPNGRRFQSVFDLRGSTGLLIGLSDEAVFYQLDKSLFAAEVTTGHVLWSRTGPQFAKSNGTVDKTLTLHTTGNEAIRLRPLDGTILQQHNGTLDEIPLWFRNTRRLSERSEGTEQRLLEMRRIRRRQHRLADTVSRGQFNQCCESGRNCGAGAFRKIDSHEPGNGCRANNCRDPAGAAARFKWGARGTALRRPLCDCRWHPFQADRNTKRGHSGIRAFD